METVVNFGNTFGARNVCGVWGIIVQRPLYCNVYFIFDVLIAFYNIQSTLVGWGCGGKYLI